MENIYDERQFVFKGKGSKLFGIMLPNWVLTFVTLGLYYPWAKAEMLKYIYHSTEFAGSRFAFHGTGKEMFKGFIKAICIFLVLYGALIGGLLSGEPMVQAAGFIFFYVGLLLLIPVAIYGSVRYRMSRTSWRGIRFAYDGNLKTMYGTFLKGIFFTLITFGLYSAWLMVNIRKEVIGNIRIGNVRFSFNGQGSELFMLHLKGYFLTILTFGIYFFWYMRDLNVFYIENMMLEQNGKYSRFDTNVSGEGYFKLLAGNLLIIVFTPGLGTPFAIIRSLRYIISNTDISGELDLNNIEQTDKDLIDATLEDVSDLMDLNLV